MFKVQPIFAELVETEQVGLTEDELIRERTGGYEHSFRHEFVAARPHAQFRGEVTALITPLYASLNVFANS